MPDYNSDNDDGDYNSDNDDITKLIARLCLRSTDKRSTLGDRLSCSSSAGGRDILPRWNLAMQGEKSGLWGWQCTMATFFSMEVIGVKSSF